jgi:tRNA G26 N,N-dimethylase Trm1
MKTAYLNMSTVHPSLTLIQQHLHRAGVSITDNSERADYMIEAIGGVRYVSALPNKRIIFCDPNQVETFVIGCTRVDITTGMVLGETNHPTIPFLEFWKKLPEPKPVSVH